MVLVGFGWFWLVLVDCVWLVLVGFGLGMFLLVVAGFGWFYLILVGMCGLSFGFGSENISHPVVNGCSVKVQRHRHNLKSNH